MDFDGFGLRGFWGGAGRRGFAAGALALGCLAVGTGSVSLETPPPVRTSPTSPARGEVIIAKLISFAPRPSSLDLSLDWHEITDKLGGFKISFPTKPKYSEKQIETGAGRMTVRAYNLEEGPISWVASWIEFPPAYVRNAGAVDILNGAKEAFFKRFKGKFLKEKIVQLGAAPGRDSLYETEDEVRIRLVAYLRGSKLVQALAIAEPDLIEGPDAKRFFESLKWE